LFLDKIAQILPNFDLKNINSTCTKDLSWKKKGLKFTRFSKNFFSKLPDFYNKFQ
jgi:hypothetical protein